MNEPTWSTSIGVHCGACGADLGDQYKPGDGAALFEAHLPNCPKGGDPDAPDARTSPPSHAREAS